MECLRGGQDDPVECVLFALARHQGIDPDTPLLALGRSDTVPDSGAARFVAGSPDEATGELTGALGGTLRAQDGGGDVDAVEDEE